MQNRFMEIADGTSSAWIAELLKVSEKTVKRWKAGEIEAPEAAILILKFIREGELSAIGGKAWEGFKIGEKDKLLYMPGFKRGIEPNILRGMFFEIQQARTMLREERQKKATSQNLKNIEAANAERFERVTHTLAPVGGATLRARGACATGTPRETPTPSRAVGAWLYSEAQNWFE